MVTIFRPSLLSIKATSFAKDDARKFPGIFANQNVVCKLRDEKTFNYLKQQFNVEEESPAPGIA